MKKAIVAVFALTAAVVMAANNKKDLKDVEWFPKEVRDAEPTVVKRFDLAPGVEYGYVYCNKLLGHPGDIHVVKIELGKAKVRPYVEEGSLRDSNKLLTTTAAAETTKALFSLNGGFFCWKDNPEKKLKANIPYYRMKLRGKVLDSNAGGTFGLAFSSDGSKVKVGRVSDAELPEWENFMAGEGILSGGKSSLEGWKRPDPAQKKPDAPRTFLGMDAEGKYLYCFATGGRKCGNKPSMGLSYLECGDVLTWFGCAEGVNMDGGGSTTLAVRKDALAKAKKPYTPESRQGSKNYFILNCTSDGNERAVLDHIQFLDDASKVADDDAPNAKGAAAKGKDSASKSKTSAAKQKAK